MKTPDERLYELEIVACDDGDILLSQGQDDCGDEIMVRLHRFHLGLLADMTGFVSANEVAHTLQHMNDRLNLLAAMVEAHTRLGDPLRAVVAAIVPDAPRHITATAARHLSPENAPRDIRHRLTGVGVRDFRDGIAIDEKTVGVES